MIFRLLFCCFCLLFASACNSQSGADAGAVQGQSAIADQAPYQDVSPEDFADKMKGANVVVLDVRTPAEIAKGKIDGAVELDYRSATFATDLAEMDPDATYLVYCASGGRSAKACAMLDGLGAREVYNLKGGYRAWPK